MKLYFLVKFYNYPSLMTSPSNVQYRHPAYNALLSKHELRIGENLAMIIMRILGNKQGHSIFFGAKVCLLSEKLREFWNSVIFRLFLDRQVSTLEKLFLL